MVTTPLATLFDSDFVHLSCPYCARPSQFSWRFPIWVFNHYLPIVSITPRYDVPMPDILVISYGFIASHYIPGDRSSVRHSSSRKVWTPFRNLFFGKYYYWKAALKCDNAAHIDLSSRRLVVGLKRPRTFSTTNTNIFTIFKRDYDVVHGFKTLRTNRFTVTLSKS